jgi:hypothetical protein
VRPGFRSVIEGNSNFVEGNNISTNAMGDASLIPAVGLDVGGAMNTIGGSGVSARNVIGTGLSVSGDENLVEGAFIGINAQRESSLGNPGSGVGISGNNNTIGGTSADARNVISGNGGSGISIGGNRNLIQGNFIGTDENGATKLGNGGGLGTTAGVDVSGSGNTIGGQVPGAGNVISGNLGDGIDISGSSNVIAGNNIGLTADQSSSLGNGTVPALPFGGLGGNGILITPGGTSNTIGGPAAGAGNVIAGNVNDGLAIGGNETVVVGNDVGFVPLLGESIGNGGDGVSVQATGNTVGGIMASDSNVITGNGGSGIVIQSSTNLVEGNVVGTDAAGDVELGNKTNGISVISPGNTIGGTASGAGNVVASSGSAGVLIAADACLVEGNWIGTNGEGSSLGNHGSGLDIQGNNNSTGGTTSGASNVIAYNTGAGVYISSGDENPILENSIFDNTTGIDLQGIDDLSYGLQLGVSTNKNIAAPTLTSDVLTAGRIEVSGTLEDAPNELFRVELFANSQVGTSNPDQGQAYVGFLSVLTDNNGLASFQGSFSSPIDDLEATTATVTDPAGDTSEFSETVPYTVLTSMSQSPAGNGSPGVYLNDDNLGDPTANRPVVFYWATGNSLNQRLSEALLLNLAVASNQTTTGTLQTVFIPRSRFNPVPPGATYLIATITLSGQTSTVALRVFQPITLQSIRAIIPPPAPPIPPASPAAALTKKQKSAQEQFKAALKAYQSQMKAYGIVAPELVAFLNSSDGFGNDQINYIERQAAFIGQVAALTMNLTTLTQGKPFGTVGSGANIGRGFLASRGAATYAKIANDYLQKTTKQTMRLMATSPSVADAVAGWFWAGGPVLHGGEAFTDINPEADRWSIASVSGLVTPTAGAGSSSSALAARFAYSNKALQVLTGAFSAGS